MFSYIKTIITIILKPRQFLLYLLCFYTVLYQTHLLSMKKLYTKYKYKRYQAKCIRRGERSRKRCISRPKGYIVGHGNNNTMFGKTAYKNIVAPSKFCIKDNPNEVVRFINKLNTNFEKHISTFVDLSKVIDISHDAIVVLLSIMYQFKKHRIKFNGNFPDDPKCRAILSQSGFLSNLYEKQDVKYDTNAKTRNIIRKHGKEALGEVAEELIKISSQNIWSTTCRCQGVYRILIELMQNTHAHAHIDKAGAENWWLSVNYDSEYNKACFSFVDYGIGVFTSLEKKKESERFYGILSEIKKAIIDPSNAKVLERILDGDLHKTATGQSYRGKGLPGIKTALIRNQISNLYIITNDAYANVCNNEYQKLSHAFDGTFVYWELTENNIKCYDTTA